MSVEPPSSGHPTGPPSGPLSGPTQPPSGPPSQPPGTGGGGGGTPEPRRPWWKSAPRVAMAAAAVVAVVALVVVLTRPGGSGGGGGSEVFAQPAANTGPDPFTASTATESSAPPVSPSAPGGSASANEVRGVSGGAPGLYGGSRNTSSCDVEKQIGFLRSDPDKNRAFASVAGVQPSGVPGYLRSLTPVQLRMDTRVTNHGYRDGAATTYQAVLQAGTAVLVDGHGVPRVRCACGNPLTQPVAQQGSPKVTGDTWPSYNPSNVVVVQPTTTIINIFVLYDPDDHDWFARQRGDTGGHDKPTPPPATPTPSVTPTSPTPCPSGDETPSTGCPSTSTSPSTPPSEPQSPGSESPGSTPPSQSPSSEPPSRTSSGGGKPASSAPATGASPPKASSAVSAPASASRSTGAATTVLGPAAQTAPGAPALTL
ncbi:DUF6777 domain-containing protein [Streptomyces sp. MUM 2J]|uniref:DUF6777 domain-containing protein n=1 Tax=Streptomyces sp. MUM 2J TaxID=2791987 RepID=UPI001F03F5F3|nr:DUF6777 domain-containing protein [Streptomyces sp. MUM 2J]MCH0566609.1 hypothetical protein [Streptomyces sp. MUM 2J]